MERKYQKFHRPQVIAYVRILHQQAIHSKVIEDIIVIRKTYYKRTFQAIGKIKHITQGCVFCLMKHPLKTRISFGQIPNPWRLVAIISITNEIQNWRKEATQIARVLQSRRDTWLPKRHAQRSVGLETMLDSRNWHFFTVTCRALQRFRRTTCRITDALFLMTKGIVVDCSPVPIPNCSGSRQWYIVILCASNESEVEYGFYS